MESWYIRHKDRLTAGGGGGNGGGVLGNGGNGRGIGEVAGVVAAEGILSVGDNVAAVADIVVELVMGALVAVC